MITAYTTRTDTEKMIKGKRYTFLLRNTKSEVNISSVKNYLQETLVSECL